MYTIDNLIRLVSPPSHPRELQYSWEDVEYQFGVQFPDDFKTILSLYGNGFFWPSEKQYAEYVQLCNYRNASEPCANHWVWRTGGYLFEQTQLPMLPDPEGLLPIASFGSDDDFFWDRRTDPWSVVLVKYQGDCVDEIGPMSFTELLFKLFCIHAADFGYHRNSKDYFSLKDFPATTPLTFEPRKSEIEIDPTVCKRIAHGGERESYRLSDGLCISLAEEFKLSATSMGEYGRSNVTVLWIWKDKHLNESLLACGFELRLRVLGENSESVEPEILLHRFKSSLQNDPTLTEQGVIETESGLIHWVHYASQDHSSTSDEIRYHEMTFTGVANTRQWVLNAEFLSDLCMADLKSHREGSNKMFQDELFRVAKSIQWLPRVS